MKILHITDLHLTPLSFCPQSRSEGFIQQITDKFDAFSKCIVEEQADCVVISGDIFHLKASHKYTPADIIYWQNQIEKFPVPVYTIPGNHDLQHSSYENLERSAYHAWVRGSKNVTDLSYKNITLGNNIRVYGIPFYPLTSNIFQQLTDLNETLDPKFINILLLHIDMIPDASIPLFWETVDFNRVLDFIPKISIVCQGHIHQSFPVFSRKSSLGTPQLVSKPWSFSRIVKDYYTKTDVLEHQHKPCYSCINFSSDMKLGIEYKVIPHTPFEIAFDKPSLKKQMEDSIQIQTFIEQIKQKFGSVENAFNIENPEALFSNYVMTNEVRGIINKYLTI